MSICFVAPHAEGALRARAGLPALAGFGGAEVQMALLGWGLSQRGIATTFVTHAVEPDWREETTVGAVRVLHLPRPRSGLSSWALQRRLGTLLDRSSARVVYQRCALPLTGRIAWLCRRQGRRFVFAVANDRDVDGGTRNSLGWARNLLYLYGLRHADMVIVQSERQSRLLEHRHHRQATLLASAFDVAGISPRPDPGDATVLWVAHLLPKKRPRLLLQIARRMPHCRFLVVGAAPFPNEEADAFMRELPGVRNVEYVGHVDPAEMDRLYREASLLLNTSLAEGVPNTFLEAWARCVPVATLGIDPDGVIASRGLGVILDKADPSAALIEYLRNGPARHEAGRRGREWVGQRHQLSTVLDSFVSALETLPER